MIKLHDLSPPSQFYVRQGEHDERMKASDFV
jgi:hypothetical protein